MSARNWSYLTKFRYLRLDHDVDSRGRYAMVASEVHEIVYMYVCNVFVYSDEMQCFWRKGLLSDC